MEEGSLDSKSAQFLRNTKISEIKTKDSDLITLEPRDTVGEALEKLAKHAITAAPIFDAYHQKIIGYVSSLDLVMYIVAVFIQSKRQNLSTTFDFETVRQQFESPLQQEFQFGSEFWPVSEDDNLEGLISAFFRWRIHRVPVTHEGKIVGNVSQMDVIRFVNKHPLEFEKVMAKRLPQVGLDTGPVISLKDDNKMIDAFSAMSTSSIYGVAVVDNKGKLCGNVSATDVKGITNETFWKLELPIREFLSKRQKLPLVVCGPEETVKEVIRLLAEKRVHRLYVIDDSGKPMNVITLTTVMKVLSQPLSDYFA